MNEQEIKKLKEIWMNEGTPYTFEYSVTNNTVGNQQFTQEELANYERLTQGVTATDLTTPAFPLNNITPNFNIRGNMNEFLTTNKLPNKDWSPSLDLGVSPDKIKFNKPTPSFLESLSTNPMLGSSLSLNDKFTIAGMSSAFDPSFIGDKNLQDKVSGVNKFTGAAALTSGIFGATKSFLAGRGIQNQNSEFMSDYFKNMRDLNTGRYQYEDGGMGMSPNAEVEDGEYIITPEQEMILVDGRTHEEGGEPVRFNGGEKIISDNLKVGAKTAKELRKQTGLDINLTDTYATVVDKYSKKLGLNKVDEEIKKYYKEIEEIKKSQDENTKRINLQFLQKQLLEKEARKQQLEQEKLAFADEMFNRQEMSKAPAKKFENGGQFNLADLASQYGMSEEEIMYLLSSQQQQFDDGGEFIIRPNFVSTLPPLSKQRTSQLPGLYGVTKTEYLQEIEKLHPEEYNKFLAGDKYKNKANVQAYQKAINSKYDNYISEIKGKVTDEALRDKYISQIEAEKFKEGELAKGFDSLLGEFTSSRPAFNLQNIGNNTGTSNTVVDSNKVVTEGNESVDPLANIKGLNLRDFRKRQSNLFIPQQYNIPPQGMLPHAKREVRLETIDPIAISPDAQLRELNRAQEFSNEALEFLPVGLRASAQANTTANLMSEYSKAISAANLFNQQNAQNVEQQNVQTRNMEENFRVGEIPRYEQMQLTAEAKTMNDIYNYFNTGMRNEVNKYNYMTKARILDSLFQNVGYDAMGNPVVDPNTMLPFEFGEARNVVQPSSYTTDPYSKKSKNSSKTKEKGK